MDNFVILDINIIRKKRFIRALHVLVHGWWPCYSGSVCSIALWPNIDFKGGVRIFPSALHF
jgi:hypothetical protein